MATRAPPPSPPLLLLFLLLITAPPLSHSLSYIQFQTLFSLSHSLTTRVANLRTSRGDLAGSNRAKLIAQRLEPGLGGLGFWGFMWPTGWDYVKNYAWRDVASFELFRAVPEVNELLRSMNELTRMESEAERAVWVGRNYQSVLSVSNSLFQRLLKVFRQSGPLREVVEAVQKEVVEGDLLRDCLELGSNDLKGLIQVLKDIALQFSTTSGRTDL